MIHHIENNQINEEVLKNNKLVVIDFFATWCGPCQMLSPIVEAMDKKYGDEVEFYKVNVDENQETTIRYGIVSVPTVIFFKNGEEVERQVGFMEENEFSKIIEDVK